MEHSRSEALRIAAELLEKKNKRNQEAIEEAREEYFKDHPFDPHKNALLGHDSEGMPSGFLTLPDMGEMAVVASKFGIEFLAICNDHEAVNGWIEKVIQTAGSPDLAGIMFANVFRGIDGILSNIIEQDRDLRQVLVNIAVEGWDKDFNDFKEDE